MNLTTAVILSLLTIGGALIVKRIVPRVGKLEALAAGFPLGVGILTWLLFLLSILGVPLHRGTIWAVVLLLALVPLWLARPRPSREILRRSLSLRWLDRQLRKNPESLGLLLPVVLLGGAALFTSLAFSYGSWDAAAIWAAKGYGISVERSIYAAELWGAHGLAYPLNLPLLISIFKTITGDLLPESKLIYPLFLASSLLGLGSHAMRRVGSKWLVVAGTVLLGTTPMVFLHGTIGYANLAFSTYLALGAVWGIEALHVGRGGAYVLSGALLGLAAWTRPEGIGYVVLILVVSSLAGYVCRGGKPELLKWLSPVGTLLAPWLWVSFSSMSSSHLGGAIRGFLPAFLSGQLNLWELYLVPRLFLDRALDPLQWGILFPVLAPVLLISLPNLNPRVYPERFALACATALMVLVPVGLFYVRSYTRPSDFYQLLNRSFDRAFLPATLMLVYLAMRVAGGSPLASDEAGAR